MKNSMLAVWLCLSLIVLGCASNLTGDIVVKTEVDPKANLGGYRTYAWSGAAQILNDSAGSWRPPEFDANSEIRFLIDRELRGRGLIEDSFMPDFIVSYAAGIDMDTLGVKTDPKSKTMSLEKIPQGALTVLLVDPETEFAVWIGQATGNIQQNRGSNVAMKRLEFAVKSLFKNFPSR